MEQPAGHVYHLPPCVASLLEAVCLPTLHAGALLDVSQLHPRLPICPIPTQLEQLGKAQLKQRAMNLRDSVGADAVQHEYGCYDQLDHRSAGAVR